MMVLSGLSRRGFLKGCIAAGVAPAFVPASVLGENAPSKLITIGMIGMGRQAFKVNLPPFLYSKDVRVIAVNDVDKWRLDNAKKKVDEHYQNSDCKAYSDWREIVARDDIDAIVISTPDQWHVPISLAAVRGGKHVCCEKPLTLSVNEGRVLADAVKKYGVVFRTDTECRTHSYMHKIAELVRNGYIGKVKRMEVAVPMQDKPGGNPEPMPVPEELDYDMWLGPAPRKAYCVDRVHPSKSYRRPGWMRCLDTCEGVITNWGTHLLDVAQLANNTERTGPVSVEAEGKYPEPGSGLWDVLIDFKAQYQYADGVVCDFHPLPEGAFLRIEGEDGWIQGDWHRRGGPGLIAHDKSVLRTKLKDSDLHIPQRQDKEDFIYGIKTGEPVMIDAEIGHRACSLGQIAHIAIQCGNRKLDWDPDKEKFSDDEANKLLKKSYREPWGLDG